APKRARGMLLSALIAAWWLGYTISFIAGYVMSDALGTSWRWMLASSAVPAAIVVLLRLGTPESPRWLASQGRIEEARAVIRKHFGESYDLEELVRTARAKWQHIFYGEYGRRTLFVAV